MLGRRRLTILAEGCFTALDAKTAVGMLRYRPEAVAAIIDSTRAGSTAQASVGSGGSIPVVASLEESARAGADGLMIGIAPQGGKLPDAWRAMVKGALERGWPVYSGLHAFLGDDPELAAIASRKGGVLVDVRRPPAGIRVAAARARALDVPVVLTVGTDCNVGKMTTALEIAGVLIDRSVRARFVATGQTGIFIAGEGIAVDAVPSDFVAGAAESLVLEAARPASGLPPDVVLVEGQGGLHHPGYSAVTLGLLHGAAPRALVLCHHAARDRIRIGEGMREEFPIPSLSEAREAYERAARWVSPAPVVAVSINTLGMDDDVAREVCARAAREIGVPASDPVRFGAAPLADALERSLDIRRGTTGTRS